MKHLLWGIVIFVLIVAMIAGAFYLTVPKPNSSGQTEKVTLWEAITDSEPSPYSLKSGSSQARIVDQQGKGVAGATVTFKKSLKKDCDGNTIEEPPAWQGVTVTCNDKGEFIFPADIWVQPEENDKQRTDIDIEAQGFLPRKGVTVGVNYGDDNGEIDLLRAGRIEGAMIDPNGEPVIGAPIHLSTGIHYNNPNEFCRGCYSANVMTDESGAFVFEKVPAGRHTVKFPGHTGRCQPDETVVIPFKDYPAFRMVQMDDGEVQTDVFLDLRLNGATVKGTVVDNQNRPMDGINVLLIKKMIHYDEDGDGWSSFTENLQSVVTDENGDYLIRRIPSGDYQLQAQYPYEKGKNYKSGDAMDIYLSGHQTLRFNLVLERQDGSKPKNNNPNKFLYEAALPDNLGPHDVMIVDPKGKPIAGAEVEFKNTMMITDTETRQNESKSWDGAKLITDERGVFRLPDVLRVGEGEKFQCQVIIKADGYQMRTADLRSYHLKDPRIDLLPLGNIEGQVIGMQGKPVKAKIEMLSQMTAYNNPHSSIHGGGYSCSPIADEGRFTIENVPEGMHIIRYLAMNADTQKQHEGKILVYTEAGENVEGLVIDLRQDTCVANGRVLDWDGKPVKKAEVRISKKISVGRNNDVSTFSSIFYQSEKTGHKGEYGIEHIHPGVYEIEAVLEGDRRRTSEKKTIAIADGQSIQLDLRLKR